MDQRGEASGEADATELSSFPFEPSEPAGLQFGRFVAAASVAQGDLELVADEFTATAGEDGQTARETCPLLGLLAESHLTKRLFGSMVQRLVGLSLPAG